MKKAGLVFLLLLSLASVSFAQELPNLKLVKLNKKAHYKDAEPLVLKVINYLFETPINSKSELRHEAGEFLVKWMNGTPDYTFVLEDRETSFFNTNADLMLVYMAAYTKFTIENPNIKNQEELVLGAMQMVLPYLNKQENKESWSKELWQLNDAQQHNKLRAYLYHP